MKRTKLKFNMMRTKTEKLRNETGIFGTKEILLTLKKGFGRCPVITELAPFNNGKGVKIIGDEKLVKINGQDGNNNFILKDMKNFNEFDTRNELLGIRKKNTLLLIKQCESLETRIRLKFAGDSRNESGVDFNKSSSEINSRCNDLQPTTNKQDRFVPNILRAQKIVNNSSTAFHATRNIGNLKRRRKQVLKPLNGKQSSPRSTSSIEKNVINCSLLRERCCKSREESRMEAMENQTSNVTMKRSKKYLNTYLQKLFDDEIEATDSGNSTDVYSADLNIFHETYDSPVVENPVLNCNDESIEQIFKEFEVPDYENYIASEDRGFNIDEMDKLVSSDIESCSIIESNTFYDSRDKFGYDENGNNIDNNFNDVTTTMQINENSLEPDGVFGEDRTEFSSDDTESKDLGCRDSNGNIIFNTLQEDENLFDDFEAPFELLPDDNFLVDNKLNINYALINEDETCESILINSKAKFDDNNPLNDSNSDLLIESTQSEDLEDWSLSVLIEREDASTDVKISKLENLLNGSLDYRDHLRSCNPSHVSLNVKTNYEIADSKEHRSTQHIQDKHSVTTSERNPDTSEDLLERHESVAQDEYDKLCKLCDKQYGSDADLDDHMKTNHRYRRLRRRLEDKKYVCNKCSKEYHLAKAMETHLQLHENYTLTCRICGTHFSGRAYLRRHMHSHRSNEKLRCYYCGKTYNRQNYLVKHLKKCGGFTKGLVKIHTLTHTVPQNYSIVR